MSEFDPLIASLFDQPRQEPEPPGLHLAILSEVERLDRRRSLALGAATAVGCGVVLATAPLAVTVETLELVERLVLTGSPLTITTIVLLVAGALLSARVLQEASIG